MSHGISVAPTTPDLTGFFTRSRAVHVSASGVDQEAVGRRPRAVLRNLPHQAALEVAPLAAIPERMHAPRNHQASGDLQDSARDCQSASHGPPHDNAMRDAVFMLHQDAQKTAGTPQSGSAASASMSECKRAPSAPYPRAVTALRAARSKCPRNTLGHSITQEL